MSRTRILCIVIMLLAILASCENDKRTTTTFIPGVYSGILESTANLNGQMTSNSGNMIITVNNDGTITGPSLPEVKLGSLNGKVEKSKSTFANGTYVSSGIVKIEGVYPSGASVSASGNITETYNQSDENFISYFKSINVTGIDSNLGGITLLFTSAGNLYKH